MNGLTIYLAIGAVIAGLAMSAQSEKCGFLQPIEPEKLVAITIGWPGLLIVLSKDFPSPGAACEQMSPSESLND